MDDGILRRIGRISISGDLLRSWPEVCEEIFVWLRFIPLQTWISYELQNGIVAEGLSGKFEVVPMGEKPPEYQVNISVEVQE